MWATGVFRTMTPRCSWDTWLLISAEPINIAHVRTNLKPDAPKLASHIHLIDNPPLIVTRAAPDVREIDLHLLVPLVEHRRLAATSDLDPMPYHLGVNPDEDHTPLGQIAPHAVITTDQVFVDLS